MTWRIHTDPSFSVGGLRALLLQALHPVAMDGVARYSAGFRDEWWMRMTRTGQYVETLTFGTRTEARRMAARVRGLHRKLSGVEETTGRAYRVDDADLLLWVHNCEVDSLLSTARRAGLPLTDDDADALRAEHLAAAPTGRHARRSWRRARWPTSTPTSSGCGPTLALTPAASEGVRRLFLLPPMPGWVQVLTPAQPAWGTFASLRFRHAAQVGAADVLDAGVSGSPTPRRPRPCGPSGTALLAVPQRARWSPIVRAGFDRVAGRTGAA